MDYDIQKIEKSECDRLETCPPIVYILMGKVGK
jgi:hypothetical protein